MIPVILDLRDYFYFQTGWVYFLMFIFILDWLFRLFRKDGR